MYAPLPIGLEDPIARFRAVHEAMRGLKESGQAVGAEMITSLADFAPPTILSQAARLQAVQRFFNLTVTNVPGPAVPALPARAPAARASTRRCPLAENCALGHRDHVLRRADRLRAAWPTTTRCPTSTTLAAALEAAIAELAAAAGVGRGARQAAAARTRARQRA